MRGYKTGEVERREEESRGGEEGRRWRSESVIR